MIQATSTYDWARGFLRPGIEYRFAYFFMYMKILE